MKGKGGSQRLGARFRDRKLGYQVRGRRIEVNNQPITQEQDRLRQRVQNGVQPRYIKFHEVTFLMRRTLY
jgi:hypothetical protein